MSRGAGRSSRIDHRSDAVERQDHPGAAADFRVDLEIAAHRPRGDSAVAAEGTGLGLAISIGLMRSMGGYLKIDSEVGRGTRVILAFDRAGTMIDPA
ncbi:MAG: ATP-binding protein [Tagaea sp.]